MAVYLKDIAKSAGVSVQTVSAVLNRTRTTTAVSEKTRDRILDLSAKMGYTRNAIATSLVKGRSSTVGLACFNLEDPHFLGAINTAERLCAAHQHTLVVATAREGVDWTEKLADGRVDFLLAVSVALLDFTGQVIPKPLQERVVVVGSWPQDQSSQRPQRQWGAKLIWDDYRGGEIAAEQLIRQGCRSVAVLAGSNIRSPKVRGAVEALARHNVKTVPIEVDQEDDKVAAGMEMGRRLLRDVPGVDGIFLRNDSFYPGLLQSFCEAEAQLTPRPHIVGYGGFFSSLTSVQTPMNTCVEHVLTTYFTKGAGAIRDKQFELRLRLRSHA